MSFVVLVGRVTASRTRDALCPGHDDTGGHEDVGSKLFESLEVLEQRFFDDPCAGLAGPAHEAVEALFCFLRNVR